VTSTADHSVRAVCHCGSDCGSCERRLGLSGSQAFSRVLLFLIERQCEGTVALAFVASNECDEELSKGLEAKIYGSCAVAIGFKRAGCWRARSLALSDQAQ
jgi:hypothetical protein